MPQAETGPALQDWFDAHVEGALELADRLPVVQHAFSHYRLHLQVLQLGPVALRDGLGDNDRLRWVAPAALDSLGLPAPIRKLLLSLE